MAIELPALPYAQDALEPHISAKTLSFHHGKHHNAYVTKCNELIAGTDLDSATVEEITKAAHAKGDQGLFNQAAQVWNHTFYWNSMSPNGGGAPTGDIADKIKEDFGSYEDFATAFKDGGATQFGTGGAWLGLDGGELAVEKPPHAGTPLVDGKTPIITMDVWEHAYYLDFQNRRPDYMGAFLTHLINWDFANANLKAA